MSTSALTAVIQGKIQNSIAYQGGQLAQLRMQAERYYKGDKFGNEVQGRSQVVSRDVAEAIDSMMPSLVKIFTSGADVVRYEARAKQYPEGTPDAQIMADLDRRERQAKQATEYCNWIWNVDNRGFLNTYTWFKSALWKKTGILKIWWDTKITTTRESYRGLTQDEYETLIADEDVEVVEEDEYPDPMAAAAGAPPPAPAPGAPGAQQGLPVPPGASPAPQPPPMLHDVTVRVTNKHGRVHIHPVPEDEFLIDRRAISLEETPFSAHRFKSTITDLVEMFPDKERLIRDLPTGEEAEYTMERLERFKDEDRLPWRQDNPADPSMREVWVTECYLKVDFDQDGFAELRKVTVGGDTGYVVLDNEEVDDHPFAALTPIIMPHKFFGMSIADQTLDLQVIKSTLIRGMLDHLYNAIAPQVGAVEGQANLDDLMNRRVGGVVRLKNPNAIVPIPNPPLGVEPAAMIEYIDSVREARTGVRRFTSGLDADTLNKNAYSGTATGARLVNDASAERLELVARVFAETGFRDAMKKILELVSKHQTRPRMIKLAGAWVSMDPREWTTEMDVAVVVGLGTGNRDQQLGHIMTMLQISQQIIALQKGISGPILTGENLFNQLEKLVEFSGFKTVTRYFTDPSRSPMPQQQQPQSDPHVQAAQISAQTDVQKAQMDMQLRLSIADKEIALKRELGLYELEIKRAELGLAAKTAHFDHALKERQLAHDVMRETAEHNLKRDAMSNDAANDAMRIGLDMAAPTGAGEQAPRVGPQG